MATTKFCNYFEAFNSEVPLAKEINRLSLSFFPCNKWDPQYIILPNKIKIHDKNTTWLCCPVVEKVLKINADDTSTYIKSNSPYHSAACHWKHYLLLINTTNAQAAFQHHGQQHTKATVYPVGKHCRSKAGDEVITVRALS